MLIASSAELFLLFGADVEEITETVTTFISKLVHDLEILENKIYDISVMGQIKKIELKVTELPNDMKILSYLGGELSKVRHIFQHLGMSNLLIPMILEKHLVQVKLTFGKLFPMKKEFLMQKKL